MLPKERLLLLNFEAYILIYIIYIFLLYKVNCDIIQYLVHYICNHNHDFNCNKDFE